MKWFKHDTDALSDAKIKKLLIRYGAIGYAIYFHCLELIASNISDTNTTFELEHDAEIIADNLKIKGTAGKAGVEIVNDVMKYMIKLGLFECEKDHIFCYKILKRLDSSMTSNKKMRQILINAKDNHDSVMTQSCKKRIEEKRIEKNRKEYKDKEVKKTTTRFSPPSPTEVTEYAKTLNFTLDGEQFCAYYEARGWMLGKVKMKSWKAAVVTWKKRSKKQNTGFRVPKLQEDDVFNNIDYSGAF